MSLGRKRTPPVAMAVILVAVTSLYAEGPFRNRDNPNPSDPAEGTYPFPYHLPRVEEIRAQLQRVHGYLDRAAPMRVVDSATGQEITDFSRPVPTAVVARGEDGSYHPLAYEMGVVHSGMLLAHAVTGDPRFADFTRARLQFVADRLPYFRALREQSGPAAPGTRRRMEFSQILETGSLDDSGSMCAALIKARRGGVGPDLLPVIQGWAEYISKRQYRMADGTLARQRPQPESLWADDLYMSVPALAQMGALTGERAWFDDAARQVLQFHGHLFDERTGLYAHGRHTNQPLNPEFYWGRANGWAMLATVELLDVLPEDHKDRARVIETLRAHVKAVAKLQSGSSGLWHQMLDKNDSYLETSASAIFVYSIAHAINRGWIAPTSYGSVAQAGWNGVVTRINEQGQVAGTCVGTTLASDHVYYYNRPASVHALHGYGPVLLAGSEMIRLLTNPAFEVRSSLRTYHYIPRKKAE